MDYTSIVIGFFGLVFWVFVIYCLCFQKIYVDRLLSRGRYRDVFVVLILVGLWIYGLTFMAWLNDVKPYDLLYYNNLYGRGTDLESKLQYRQNIVDKINEQAQDPTLFGTVFYHFRGFGTEFAAGTPKGRVWAFIISISGLIVIGGLLFPCVLRVITRRTDAYKGGEQRYNIQRSPYAVIFGAHETVPALIKKILSNKHEQKIKYVIVHTSEDVPAYRRDLESRLTPAENRHVIIYRGMRTNPSEIVLLHMERAKEAYILGEKMGHEAEADHDSMNMECVRLMASYLADKKRKDLLKSYVLFEYQTTYTSFLYSDLNQIIKDRIEFVYMNYYTNWAHNVLSNPPSSNPEGHIQYMPLEGNDRIDKNSDLTVHLIVVGMTKMGMALAIEAAQIAHYPNFCTHHKRTKITFLDSNIDIEMQKFMGRYSDYFALARWRKIDIEREEADDVKWNDPLNEMAKMKREGRRLPFDKYPYSHLADPKAEDANFIDVEWEFIKGSVETHTVKEYLIEHALNDNELLTVAICHSYAPDAIATGMYLPREVYRNAVQVLVNQKQSADIIKNISGSDLSPSAQGKLRFNKLRPFGMLADCFSDYIIDNRLAKLINFVYNCKQDTDLKCADEIDPEKGVPRMDVYWRETLVSNQWSSKCNANALTTKLRFMGLDPMKTPIVEIKRMLRQDEVLSIIAQVEHNRWNTEKLLLGFRPLNDREIAPFLEILEKGLDPKTFYDQKNGLKKGWEMAHLNICSFEMLKKYDRPSIEYDYVMTKVIPSVVEWMRDTL